MSKKSCLIVGSGLTGSTAAWKLAESGWKVTIYEAELLVGGHVRTAEFGGLLYEQNGIHVFHTENEKAMQHISRFTELIPYEHRVLTEILLGTFSWPIQLEELEKLPNWKTIEREITNLPSNPIDTNFETYAISLMGKTLYQMFVEPYTRKQWGEDPKNLSASFAPKRIDFRRDGNKKLFKDKYQGWPRGGWTNLIEKMLLENPIEIILGRCVTEDSITWSDFDAVIVTAPLDQFLNEEQLPWRGVKVEHHFFPKARRFKLQAGQVNHPGMDEKYTRRTETKWMSGQSETHLGTFVTYEFPVSNLRHYPVDDKNGENKKRANSLKQQLKFKHSNAIVAGRLANYVYINTDQAIIQGLNAANRALRM